MGANRKDNMNALVAKIALLPVQKTIQATIKQSISKIEEQVFEIFIKNLVAGELLGKEESWWNKKMDGFLKQDYGAALLLHCVNKSLNAECNWGRAIIARIFGQSLLESRDIDYKERILLNACNQITDRQIKLLCTLCPSKYAEEVKTEGNIKEYFGRLGELDKWPEEELINHIQWLKKLAVLAEPMENYGGRGGEPSGHFKFTKTTNLLVKYAEIADY